MLLGQVRDLYLHYYLGFNPQTWITGNIENKMKQGNGITKSLGKNLEYIDKKLVTFPQKDNHFCAGMLTGYR